MLSSNLSGVYMKICICIVEYGRKIWTSSKGKRRKRELENIFT
jgi:hypothetical protein